MIINKNVIEAWLLSASDGKKRPILSSLHISEDEDNYYIDSTDAYRMTRITQKKNTGTYPDTNKFFLSWEPDMIIDFSNTYDFFKTYYKKWHNIKRVNDIIHIFNNSWTIIKTELNERNGWIKEKTGYNMDYIMDFFKQCSIFYGLKQDKIQCKIHVRYWDWCIQLSVWPITTLIMWLRIYD